MQNTTISGATFDLAEDLTVRRLGLAAMRLTGEGVWGEPDDVEAAKRLLRRAVELGVDLIDTADAYSMRPIRTSRSRLATGTSRTTTARSPGTRTGTTPLRRRSRWPGCWPGRP